MQTRNSGELFLHESQTQFTKARNYVNHCLKQLDDDAVWWTPETCGTPPESVNSVGGPTNSVGEPTNSVGEPTNSVGEPTNSVGIILQHVCGNLRQWILSGVGGAPDTRNRPQEFAAEVKVSKADLQQMFNAVLDEALATVANLPPERLLEHRTIQETEQSLLGAVYVAITHLDMHVGQILYLTRLKQGPAYEVFWKPGLITQTK